MMRSAGLSQDSLSTIHSNHDAMPTMTTSATGKPPEDAGSARPQFVASHGGASRRRPIHRTILGWVILALVAIQMGCAPSREDRIAEIRAIQSEGRFVETVESVMQLFEEFPDDPDIIRLYGMTMLAIDNPGLAIWPLRTLVEHHEGDVDDHILLAKAFNMGGAPIEAFEAIKEAVAARPDDETGLTLHAALALEANDYDAVLSSTEILIDMDPVGRPLAYVWQGKALVGLDRFEEADESLALAAETLTVRPDIDIWRAKFCGVSIEVAEAEEDEAKIAERWEKCLEEFPLHQETFSGAVKFFDDTGDRDRATAVLENVVELAPKFVAVRSQLAERLAAERRYSEAEALLIEATKDPEIRSNAWVALGDYHRNRENLEKAIQATVQGLSEFESVSALVLAQLADDCVQARQFEKAESFIEQIDVPEYAALLRGRIELEKGNPTKAREYLLDGLRSFTSNAAARYLAGRAAEQLGDLDLAIADYRDAVRSGAGDSDAPFRLARLYEAEGSFEAAYHMLGLRQVKLPNELRTREELAMMGIRLWPKETAQSGVEAVDQLPGQQSAATVLAGRLEARHGGPAAGAAKIIERSRERDLDLTLPNYVDVLRELVVYLGRSEQSAEGLERARAAVTADSEFARFYEVLAAALISAARPREEVEEVWTRALELDSKSVRALVGMGDLAADVEQLDEALEFYDRATDADRDNTDAAWRAIAALLSSSDQTDSDQSDDPVGEEDPAEQREPDSQSAQSAVIAGDRSDEIDQRLDELLKVDSIHARALNVRAGRLVEDGSDLDRAEELARRAIRFTGNAHALEALGLLSLERGENARAIRAFRLALQRRPNAYYLSYHLGRALLADGNEESARAALERSLEGQGFAEASDARMMLEKLDAENGDEKVDE